MHKWLSSAAEGSTSGDYSSIELPMSSESKQFDPNEALALDPEAARVRAVISPHAGYTYCGDVCGYAYSALTRALKAAATGTNSGNLRVFILGPSHHHYMSSCALTTCSQLETPLGLLDVDTDIVNEIYGEGDHFTWFPKTKDEMEHSIEMQLPFVFNSIQESRVDVKVVPIVVGSIDTRKEALYGKLLAPYIVDPCNVFVMSSDFCHWGQRFDYVRTKDGMDGEPIWKAIQRLDTNGMQAICSLDPSTFQGYLKSTGNTICGRHPIAVYLHGLQANESLEPNVKFVKYSQSSKAKSKLDSSVSYAAAYVEF